MNLTDKSDNELRELERKIYDELESRNTIKSDDKISSLEIGELGNLQSDADYHTTVSVKLFVEVEVPVQIQISAFDSVDVPIEMYVENEVLLAIGSGDYEIDEDVVKSKAKETEGYRELMSKRYTFLNKLKDMSIRYGMSEGDLWEQL